MPKLKVGVIYRAILHLLCDQTALVGRSAGVWFILLAIADFGASAVAPAAQTLTSIVGAAVFRIVVEAIASAGCAVNIHRLILLRDRPVAIRVRLLELRYILRAIQVWVPALFVAILAVGAMTVAAVLLLKDGQAEEWWRDSPGLITHGIAIALAVILIAVLVLPRTLALAALAIGHAEYSIGQSEEITQGNGVAFCLLYLAIVAAGIFIDLIGGAITSGLAAIAPAIHDLTIASHAVLDAFRAITDAVLFAAIVSFVYAGLVQRNAEFVA